MALLGEGAPSAWGVGPALSEGSGRTVEATFDGNWFPPERSRLEFWRWSSGSATVTLHNPQPFALLATVSFSVRCNDTRKVGLWQDEYARWERTLKRGEVREVKVRNMRLEPGETLWKFATDVPAAYPDSNDRRRLWKLAAKGWTRLAPFAVLFFMAAEAAVLSLMGKHQYGMDAWMMLFFALCSTLLLVQSSLMQILAAGGVRALRIGMFLVWGAGLFNFAACLLLIPRFRIIGAAGAFILTYVLQLLWLRRYGDSWLE